MEVFFEQNQASAKFTIHGAIDEQGAQILKDKFTALDKSSIKTMIFDFKTVTHIGSAGIGKLLLFYKDIAIGGGVMEIINVSGSIYDLLLTLKLNSVFKIQQA